MLTSDQINSLKDNAAQLTNSANEYAIAEICRRIAEAGRFTRDSEYKRWRAQAMGAGYDELTKEIAKRLNVAQADIIAMHYEAAKVIYESEVPDFTRESLAFEDNETLQQIIKTTSDLAQEDFTNVTQTMGMVSPTGQDLPLKQFYRETVDWVFNKVSTGLMDYNTAIRKASDALSNRGLTAVGYESGVTTSLEAAVRRNVMSGVGLMAEQVSRYNHDLIGANGWEMSAHLGCAVDHEPYQGRQYTDEEWDKLNGAADSTGELLRRVGTLNCGHYAFPIIIGVNQPQLTEKERQQLITDNVKGVVVDKKHYTYEQAQQRQRAIERKIRKWKKRVKASAGAGDIKKARQANIRITRARQEYKRFSKEAGLPTQDERLYVSGFDFKAAKKISEFINQQLLKTQ